GHLLGLHRGDGLVEVHGLEHRGQAVVAALVDRPDAQRQVQLPGSAHHHPAGPLGNRLGKVPEGGERGAGGSAVAGRCRAREPGGHRGSRLGRGDGVATAASRAAPAAAIARNCSTSRVSPRAPESTPASRGTCSGLAAGPAPPATAARTVLRRWAKAASTTEKTLSRSVGVPSGCSCRSRRTRAESTLGTGQKMCREILPAWESRPYQAALTL